MATEKRPKFFMTSDCKFVINIDKIAFIDLNIYGDEYVKNENSIAYYFNTQITHDFSHKLNSYLSTDYSNSYLSTYFTPNKVNGSYFYVYVEGSESPLKLIYGDGIQLINLIATNSGGGIFYNQYPARLIDVSASYYEVDKETKYKYAYTYVPNLAQKMFVTNLNDIKFNGDQTNNDSPYSTEIFLTSRTK